MTGGTTRPETTENTSIFDIADHSTFSEKGHRQGEKTLCFAINNHRQAPFPLQVVNEHVHIMEAFLSLRVKDSSVPRY
jgi:hypothetical protein